jgi:aromatic-L-amino-acid decarboxylase
VREIASDDHFRIRLDLLEKAIECDRQNGFTPFFIAGNAGTTNTGAIDPLDSLADLASREGLWLHVDAAYGGFFMLTERGRAALSGIHRADSITLDPHKGLFLPYGTGCLLAKDAGALSRAHSLNADYLPPMQEESDLVDFCQISPELSRDFRGLRVWLPFSLHGVEPFRKCLDEKLDLAIWATEELRTIGGIRIVAAPELSLVAFRFEKDGLDREALNARNRAILERVNTINRVHITATIIGGVTILRICVLSFRTHRDRLEAALQDIRLAVRETGLS